MELQRTVLQQTGGTPGVRDLGLLESAVAQPYMAFDGQDLYPTLIEKACALAYSHIKNHAFVDGNKRIGHAAMETFLVLNDHEMNAPIDEQEQVVLRLAAGHLGREDFTQWVRAHVVERRP